MTPAETSSPMHDASWYRVAVRFSEHFERDRRHQPDRTDFTIGMCERVVAEPMRTSHQEDGRIVYWGHASELSTPEKSRYLRVVVEPDGETVWTAHLDRNFRKRAERGEVPTEDEEEQGGG